MKRSPNQVLEIQRSCIYSQIKSTTAYKIQKHKNLSVCVYIYEMYVHKLLRFF